MRGNAYDSYRGRNRFATFLKVLIVLLLLVLAVGVAALFFLEPYLVYSADGVRLDLPPFFQGQEDAPVTSTQPPVVVSTVQPTATPERQEEFRGVILERSALYDGTAQTQGQQAGANAIIFDMKADDGTLAYISQQEMAQTAGVSAEDPAINAAIQLVNGGELYTVARVSCFRDNTVPRWSNSWAVRSSSGNWRDEGNSRWLSVGNAEARAYVVGICQELAGLGFDELLLDNCGYPVQGRVDRIRSGEDYDSEDLTGPVEQFFQELQAALADYPEVKLSVVTTPELLSGTGDTSGLTLTLLEEYGVRVLAAADESGTLPVPEGCSVVPVVETPGGAEEQWAVLAAPMEF